MSPAPLGPRPIVYTHATVIPRPADKQPSKCGRHEVSGANQERGCCLRWTEREKDVQARSGYLGAAGVALAAGRKRSKAVADATALEYGAVSRPQALPRMS